MSWISNRLAEPSTRIGLGIFVATLAGVSGNPPHDLGGWFTVLATFAAALSGVFTKAPGSPDAPANVPGF